jgi:O-antigen ligase
LTYDVSLGRHARPAEVDAVAWLTFYLILLLFVPSRLIFGPLGSAGAPSILFGLDSLFVWFLLRIGATQTTPSGLQPIRIALLMFLLSAGISYLSAMSAPMSSDEISPADVALLAVASWSGTFLLSHDFIFDRKRLDTLIWRLCVCGGLIALLGIVQVLTRKVWVDQFSIPGLTGSPAYGLNSRGGFPRPVGFATHPIEFGTLIAMILPLALYVGFTHSGRRLIVRWLPAGALAALVPLTSSRSAYLGAAIGLVICMAGWSKARRLKVLGLIGVGIGAMSVVTPNLVSSIIGLFSGAGDDPSVESRTGSFALAIQFIEQKPWFGRGLGTFLPKYRIFDNEYLLLLVTVGIIGTVAFLALGVTAFATLLSLRARIVDEGSRDLAMALAASCAAGFACLFMFDAFAFPMTMGLLFLVLGMGGAFRRIEQASTHDLSVRV